MTESQQADAPDAPEDITELFTGDENDPDEAGYLGGTAMMRD